MSTQVNASKKLGYLILNYMLGVDVPEESAFGNMFSKDIAGRLDRVQGIRNFRHVMDRLLRQGEPGAWAEVDVASRIRAAGYYVAFSSPKAPDVNPDLIAKFRHEKVFFEVVHLQPPKGGGRRLSEANRVKRAVDNKTKQLPDRHKGVIVVYNQDIPTNELSPGLVKEIKKKIARYPNIMAVAVVKPLFKRGGTSKVDKKRAYILSRQVFRGVYSRYSLIVKGKDAETRLFRSVRDVLCRRL